MKSILPTIKTTHEITAQNTDTVIKGREIGETVVFKCSMGE